MRCAYFLLAALPLLGACSASELTDGVRNSNELAAAVSTPGTTASTGNGGSPAESGIVDPTWPGSYEGSLQWKVEGDAMDVNALLVLRPDGRYTIASRSWSYEHQQSGSYEANGDVATLHIPASESIMGEAIACELTRKDGEIWGLGPCMGWVGESGGDEMPFRGRASS